MLIDVKKTYEIVVPSLKMEETLKLLKSLQINQEHIASQLNIQLPCKLNDIRDAPTTDATAIRDSSEG